MCDDDVNGSVIDIASLYTDDK